MKLVCDKHFLFVLYLDFFSLLELILHAFVHKQYVLGVRKLSLLSYMNCQEYSYWWLLSLRKICTIKIFLLKISDRFRYTRDRIDLDF